MGSDVSIANTDLTGIAVALGRVEQDVKHIRSDGEKSSQNVVQFQLSVQAELKDLDTRTSKNELDISEIVTRSKTSMKWLTVLITVIQVAGMIVFGIISNI